MKMVVLAPLLAFIMLFCATGGIVAQETSPIKESRVVAYYFHTNARCSNCHNMEKWTREALDEGFGDEIKSGRLDLRIINLDVKGNEHFAIEYQLFTKSVILSLVKGAREMKFVNLTKIWEYLTNKEKFKAYIKEEVARYMKELK